MLSPYGSEGILTSLPSPRQEFLLGGQVRESKFDIVRISGDRLGNDHTDCTGGTVLRETSEDALLSQLTISLP
jgi:hypothetical protein